MKTLVLIFSILISLSGCNDNDNRNKQETSIVGSWQLIKRTSNNIDDSPNYWENIDNGHNIIFRENLNYESNEFTACENNINQGIFKLNKVSNDSVQRILLK